MILSYKNHMSAMVEQVPAGLLAFFFILDCRTAHFVIEFTRLFGVLFYSVILFAPLLNAGNEVGFYAIDGFEILALSLHLFQV